MNVTALRSGAAEAEAGTFCLIALRKIVRHTAPLRKARSFSVSKGPEVIAHDQASSILGLLGITTHTTQQLSLQKIES
jgi:hypothetical protein